MDLVLRRRNVLALINWPLVILTLAVCAAGAINLRAAAADTPALFTAQVTWMLAGAAIAAVLCLADYKVFDRLAWFAYALGVVLLVLVFIKGSVRGGAQRWLDIGPAHIQPSEFMKPALILILARYFGRLEREAPYGLRQLLKPFALIAVPAVLVLKQPDLGTAAMIGLIGMTMILFTGVKARTLIFLTVCGLAGAVLGWVKIFKPYQKQRILTFLNPENDVLGAAYHVTQSVIAIGSGEMHGKGYGKGTQTAFSFLPEQHTDFIFSVWAEEQGFVGGATVIACFFLLTTICMLVARDARDRHGALLAVGAAGLLFWHAFINIAMVTGLLPVVGITLPLFSYGGSAVIAVFIVLGLAMNVSIRGRAAAGSAPTARIRTLEPAL